MSEKFTVLRVDMEGVMKSVKESGGEIAAECRISLQFCGVGEVILDGEIGASVWGRRGY